MQCNLLEYVTLLGLLRGRQPHASGIFFRRTFNWNFLLFEMRFFIVVSVMPEIFYRNFVTRSIKHFETAITCFDSHAVKVAQNRVSRTFQDVEILPNHW